MPNWKRSATGFHGTTFIARSSFVLELREACKEIAERPTLYPFHEDSLNLRRRLVRPHLIFYRVRGDTILIVSVRHGTRDNRRLR